ncbi:YciI family protein [Streptomyces sp. NBC_00059]|uniref:YciI family protein n=1 Tax=Streptomyces sp. NBC_00059 TaxID=2975635 RepID=UPI00225AC225|nr:YciI family protein [Streptomyces sp. NBC_00059]MCX5415735.1 YciI family protein [Streptomyces sp. NBC_00059]
MATFAVTYTYAEDSAGARDQHRPEHKNFLEGHFDAGRLRVSGPLGADGAPGALLVFEAESADELAGLLDQDPFHREGLIALRTIRAWQIFFGGVK